MWPKRHFGSFVDYGLKVKEGTLELSKVMGLKVKVTDNFFGGGIPIHGLAQKIV